MIFEVKLDILVTPKQEVEQKSEWFCGVIFFALFLKKSEKAAFERKFGFSLMVFGSYAAISLGFYCFFYCLGRILF